MATQTLDAVFDNGVFQPLAALTIPIPKGKRVRLTVEPVESWAEALVLATQVYEGLSADQIDEIEHIAVQRRDFFTDRTSV